MAEGRMLKKVICESPRLAALKNDTNRLIYTWLIPHLDVEGRHSADIRILKSHIAPILNHITHKILKNSLIDMAENDLIALYDVDGKPYLELKRFHKHQVLREGRERASDIPASSVGTPSALRRPSVDTAAQEKLREVKLREGNAREDVPVDNSEQIPMDPTAQEEEKPDPLFADLKTIIEAINEKLTPYNQRQVMMFVESNVKGKNHNAIIHCLQSLLKKLTDKQPEDEIKPRAYLEAALNGNDERAGEDGKHNAEDHEQQAQGKKGPATAAGLQAFGRIMAEIGRASP